MKKWDWGRTISTSLFASYLCLVMVVHDAKEHSLIEWEWWGMRMICKLRLILPPEQLEPNS